jgi:MOSC domain-containing protein YiiM
MAVVTAVCTSEKKGIQKRAVPEISIKKNLGIEGDAHAGDWHRQISLLGEESVDKIRPHFPNLKAGAFAENILTKGITLYELPIGTKLRVGETLLEVTQIGKECHTGCAIKKKSPVTASCQERAFLLLCWKKAVLKPGIPLR